jgi:spore maturation protein CgeB
MSKSVLHIRIDSPGFNSNAIARGFIENGFDYYPFSWQQFRFSEGLENLRKAVVSKAAELKPSIIFCHIQNPEAFDLHTWIELTKHGFVVNYTFDVRYASEMNWMYEVAPHIGHTFFACNEDVRNCLVIGIQNVSSIHSSCDMDLYKSIGKHLYAFDIVFCGNRYDNTNLNFPLAEERQQMISFLEHHYKSSFMSYGLGQKGGLIQPEVEANVYNFSRIAINQNNFCLQDYTSDRIWRIMSSGCFCLTKYFPGIENIFKKERHLDWWNDLDELKTLLDFYIQNNAERYAIAQTGMKYVRENHSWANRITEISNTCKL